MTTPNPQQLPAQIAEVRKMREMVDEVTESLRSQSEILKRRNRTMPPSVFQSLDAAKQGLHILETALVEEHTEMNQLRSLAATSALINTSLDLDDVLTRAMNEVIALTGAERGFIILRNEDTGELEFRLARDNLGNALMGGQTQISTTILREVIDTGTALLADNAYKDPRMQDNMSIAQLTLRSVLCVPLTYREQIVGAVYVDNRLRAGIFQDREMSLLQAFANQAAVAVENARLFMRIKNTIAQITELRDLMDNVFSSVGSGIITADAEHTVLTFNRAAEDILDYPEEDAIGSRVREVLPIAAVDLDDLLDAAARGESQTVDSQIELEERGRVSLNIKLSPLRGGEGQTQGVAMVVDDLTAQRAHEEELDIMRRYLPPALVENIQSISQLALGGERREVTCMFVDARGLGSFPPGLRPQQIMEELNIYLALATKVINDTNGVIDKYMGNEIMVMYNTQLNPMLDHAVRAVEAAIGMRRAYLELYQQLGIDPNPHFYRMGIHTGVATLGNVGSLNRRDFTAIGDTINLSKRLEENAKAGQIIVSDETRQQMEAYLANGATQRLSRRVRFEEREPIQVKGRQQVTRIYEVFEA